MSRNKTPGEIADSELEKLIEESKDIENPVLTTDRNDVLKFLSTFNIQPGTHIVTARFLYTLYTKWSTQPVNNAAFTANISVYIPGYSGGYGKRKYQINLNIFQLTKAGQRFLSRKIDKTKSKIWKRHFEAFLKAHNITKGNTYIEGSILFHLYDKWNYDNNRKQINQVMGYNHFQNFMSIYFESKRVTVSRMLWFGVNESIFNTYLSKDKIKELTEAKEGLLKQKYVKKQRTRTKKKKIKKISS